MSSRSIFIGFDPRECAGFAVARNSARRHLTQPIPMFGLKLANLQAEGLYTRPIERRYGPTDAPVMRDTISNAPMSTEHANARFLIPYLAPKGSLALFMDGDILVRGNLARLFDQIDGTKALYCVKHVHEPAAGVKMDGQYQTQYARKNWSSFMVWNLAHEAHERLTLQTINTVPGRDLHRFCWLDDDEIGDLDFGWNWLVRHSPPLFDPQVVHFTNGLPDMPGFENDPYADAWRQELNRWVAGSG